MRSLINFLLFIVDFNHKKKILSFLKSYFYEKPLTIIDVGAHKGETLNLFLKNFNIKEIICYEASLDNFNELKNFTSKISKKNSIIKFYNFAIGDKKMVKEFHQTSESSSSTFATINFKSQYFKKKNNILKLFFGKKYVSKSYNLELQRLEDEFIKHNLTSVDILKIDTEGFEYQIIKGLGEKINQVRCIYFEHHFDQMIVKDYTFRMMHVLLTKANFKKIFKIKMPYRKTFEYIYVNKKII